MARGGNTDRQQRVRGPLSTVHACMCERTREEDLLVPLRRLHVSSLASACVLSVFTVHVPCLH